MISPVDVVNKALNHLQVPPISSLDENSEAAARCKSVFDTVRDTVLAGYRWRFATFIEKLTDIVDETIPGWEYLYAEPLKCLAIRKIFVDTGSEDPDPIDYRRCISPETEKKAIATNYDDSYIEYTRQVSDPALWDTAFAEALALRMAAEVGPTLTGKNDSSGSMMQLYAVAISEAKRLDGESERITKTKTSSYEDARG